MPWCVTGAREEGFDIYIYIYIVRDGDEREWESHESERTGMKQANHKWRIMRSLLCLKEDRDLNSICMR